MKNIGCILVLVKFCCLKRANTHMLLDLLSTTEEDLMKIDSFRMEYGKLIWDAIKKHLPIDLPNNKFSL